jgi:uncharacterized protein (TIGR03032 family)
LDSLWSRHHAQWRDPAQVTAQWQDAAEIDHQLLRYRVRGDWWDVLAAAGITLLVTREYEHLVMALSAGGHAARRGGKRASGRISFMRLPHPSGLVVDRDRHVIHIASTRNPNHVYDLVPAGDPLHRRDVRMRPVTGRPLMPIRSRFFPGCLYLHDLAMIAGNLYGNAVGQNAVVRLDPDGSFERVWWPRCIETSRGPIFSRNHLQLNSIAAGTNLRTSLFAASTDRISARRPGHRNFAVDRRGVIFSGATREPVARGLTRPHSVRLHRDQVWVANSGYGELVLVCDGGFVSITRLSGWTRGLCFHGSTAFVGTSRVIPRFRHYAPGLDVDQSQCAVHAIDIPTGRVLGSLIWPAGNQIFALDWVPIEWNTGLPFGATGRRNQKRDRQLFYAFTFHDFRQNGAGE